MSQLNKDDAGDNKSELKGEEEGGEEDF